MKFNYLLIFLSCFLLSCNSNPDDFIGKYELEVKGLKNVSSGKLEIVGEPGDYFGRIVFEAKRNRSYEIGLNYNDEDSLYFILPGQGGFLSLKKTDSLWKGNFKYFGLEAAIIARRIGKASEELTSLVPVKPIGKGIISTNREESFPSFDAVNSTLYFSRGQKIYSSQFLDSNWEHPVKLNLTGDYNDSAPYIFNNGQSLLFTSNRPVSGNTPKKKNLWLTHKIEDKWTTPKPLPHPINLDSVGDYHGAALDNGKYYFVSYNRIGGYGRSDIFSATTRGSGDVEVINLGNKINSEKSEADIFIDNNERFLLFASTGRTDSYGADDIYISFKEGDSWSIPQNIGPKVNSFAYEYGAWVDQINNYLYFNSYRRGTSDLYRISLDELDVFKRAMEE